MSESKHWKRLIPHAEWAAIEGFIVWGKPILAKSALGALVLALGAAAWEWFRSHVDIIGILVLFFVSLLLFLFSGFRGVKAGKKDARVTTPPLNKLPPTLKVFIRPGDSVRKWILSTDHPSTLEKVRLRHLVSVARYEYTYDLMITPSTLTAVRRDSPVPFQVLVDDSRAHQIGSLDDLLGASTPHTLDAVIIDFETEGERYSQQCTLMRNSDGSVTWMSGNAIPSADFSLDELTVIPQDLQVLRYKLTRADGWQTEHDAFQNYFDIAKTQGEQIRLLTWKLHSYPNAAHNRSLAAEAKRLHGRLMEMLKCGELPERDEFAELLKRPLSEIDPCQATNRNYGLAKWRFQEDFEELRKRLPEVLNLPIQGLLPPARMESRFVLDALAMTANQLESYAAKLLDETSTNPTTSATDHT